MIRIRVPLDLHAVATDGSAAFAMATPLRVREVLTMAVREAIGALAPPDKLHRSVGRTLAGFERGDFWVTIDGRAVRDADAVLVCQGCADVRFFLNLPHATLRSSRPAES